MAAGYLDPPPRDFTAAGDLTPERMVRSIRDGRSGTAMRGFSGLLSEREIADVAAFIAEEFMACRRPNTAYHTAANGWPEHLQRYGAAYPYVLGERPLDDPGPAADRRERAGLRLYRESCVVCHDRYQEQREDGGPDVHGRPVAESDRDQGYAEDRSQAPVIANPTPAERRGERLYQANCALCHAADGRGRNWIGRFLEPGPPDLTAPGALERIEAERGLEAVILEGLPGTSMPAFQAVITERDAEAIAAYLGRAFAPGP